MTPRAILRFWPFWAGLILTALMLVLSFTPLAWHLSGSPSESYPELFFLVYGVPAALLITLIGVVHAWAISRKASPVRPDGELHR